MKRTNYIWHLFDGDVKYKIELKNDDGSHMLFVNDKNIDRINRKKSDIINYDYKFDVGKYSCDIINYSSFLINESPVLFVDGFKYDSKEEKLTENIFPGVPKNDIPGLIVIVIDTLMLIVTIVMFFVNKFQYILIPLLNLILMLLAVVLYKYPFRYTAKLMIFGKTVTTNKYLTIFVRVIISLLLIGMPLLFLYFYKCDL